MAVFRILILFGFLFVFAAGNDRLKRYAAVTLVTGAGSGNGNGYTSGAIALGQSLRDVGSVLELVAMVSPDVPSSDRAAMRRVGWEVSEVEPMACNIKHKFDSNEYDLTAPSVQAGQERWRNTCTKFRAWSLTQFARIVFMDADTLAVENFDDVVLFGSYSNATFAAAPETFPPDTFNAGFLLISPSVQTAARLVQLNLAVGSVEGGDQGVLNNGLCPSWYTASPSDPHCGRLPWLLNVDAHHYEQYKALQVGSGKRLPAVIHFVSDGKPWTVMQFEFLSVSERAQVPSSTREKLASQAVPHMLWRNAYYKGIAARDRVGGRDSRDGRGRGSIDTNADARASFPFQFLQECVDLSSARARVGSRRDEAEEKEDVEIEVEVEGAGEAVPQGRQEAHAAGSKNSRRSQSQSQGRARSMPRPERAGTEAETEAEADTGAEADVKTRTGAVAGAEPRSSSFNEALSRARTVFGSASAPASADKSAASASTKGRKRPTSTIRQKGESSA
jgi:hypothetical protein